MADNLTFSLDVDSSKAVSSINTFFDTFDKGALQAKSKLNAAFGQTIQTDIKVEFKNGALVAKEVQSLKQESSKLAQAYKAVNGELGKTPNQLKRQQATLKGLLGDTQKFKEGTRQLTAEWKTLTGKIQQVESALKTMSTSGSGGLSGLTSRFIGIQTAANLATAGIMNVVRSIGELVQTAFRMETLNLQLEAFTGSAEAAEETFNQFLDIAANSPLNLEQVGNAGKIMMAFGLSTDEAIEATEQLALVSAATGGDINLLARNMGQIVAQGRAYTRDLTQFAIQGIPIWEQLSVVTGKNTEELKDMAKNGRITGTEVSAALKLMTREGTAFFEIGQRMQETFAGRFAAIEAAVQNLASEFIDSFNTIDKGMGSIVSGSMKAAKDGINFLAANMETLGLVIASVTIGIGFFFATLAVAKIAAIVTSLGGLSVVFGLLKAQILAAFQANLLLVSTMGPAAFLATSIAIFAAAATYAALTSKMKENATEAITLDGEIQRLTRGTKELTEAQEKYAFWQGNSNDRENLQKYKDQQNAVKALNEELTIAVEILKEQQEERNKDFEKQQANIQQLITAEEEKIAVAKKARDEAVEAVETRYEREKSQLDDILSKIRERYDLEIGNLRAKTPAEKELYDLEKRKLEEKIRGRGLDKEELLRLQARLERMNANEKIQKLMVDQKKEEEAVAKKMEQLDDKKKTDLDVISKKYKDVAVESKEIIEEQQQQMEESKQKQKEFNELIDNSLKSVGDLGEAVDTSTQAVNRQIGEVQDLATAYSEAAGQAERLRDAVLKKPSKAPKAAPPNTFTGGPVSGGELRTVNEFGKEAFLTASGKLSMINAPAWGEWRAPSTGTIIPAHLTKQLDIPTGGININSAAASAATGASSGGVGAILKALRGGSSGDVFNQSVTVQSANPTQTANNMMVEMTRLRRRRFS